jgi:hypothetical protein
MNGRLLARVSMGRSGALADGQHQRMRRLGLRHDAIVEPDAERVFEPQQEFDPFETADAEVAIEAIVEGRRPGRPPEFGHQSADDLEHLPLDRRRVRPWIGHDRADCT